MFSTKLSCSYFQPSNIYQHLNIYHYTLLGYGSGFIVSMLINKSQSNKYELYYQEISYRKLLLNIWTITGLSVGLFYGYNNKFLK